MNKYWFRKRRGLFTWDMGWGWIPISWEGWLLLAMYFIAIFSAGILEGVYKPDASISEGIWFCVDLLFLTLLLAFVCSRKCRPDKKLT